MTSKPQLAILGASPKLGEFLPVGQFYWPDWERYENAVQDIFARRHYASQANAGPLVNEFERRLEQFLGVRHAIVVRNGTIGLMMAIKAAGFSGKIIVPSWTFIPSVQSLAWANCQPVFCDIDPQTQQMSASSVRKLLEENEINGILGVDLWGDVAPVEELDALSKQYDVPVLYDAAHAFGCQRSGLSVGGFGLAEVFSFHATKILTMGEGGCITTNDDHLALKLRLMRGDHPAEPGIIVQTANARVSEIQAAVGMMSLTDFESNRANNQSQHLLYEHLLKSISGVTVLQRTVASKSNYQYLVATIDEVEFGLNRDQLLAVLKAENVIARRYFYPSCHRVNPFDKIQVAENQLDHTLAASRVTLQLPIGARVTTADIETVCEIVRQAQAHSVAVKSAVTNLVLAK